MPNKMKKINLFAVSLVMLITFSIGLLACTANSSNSRSSSEGGESNSNKQVQQAPQIPPKVKEIYDYINGKTFSCSYYDNEEGDYGEPIQISTTLYLTFRPSNEYEGTVDEKITTQTLSLGSGANRKSDNKTVDYLIEDDGTINVGALQLRRETATMYGTEMKGKYYLISNQDDGNGGYLKFY